VINAAPSPAAAQARHHQHRDVLELLHLLVCQRIDSTDVDV
jgi:hypothetical protein